MAERSKQVLLFLDPLDEEAVFGDIETAVPDVRLVDGSRWPTSTPPTHPRVGDCTQGIVYLWSPSVRPDLPFRERGGAFDGPSSGVVVQWWRSQTVGDELRSGRFAVGFDAADVAMKEFVDAAFGSLRRMTTDRLQAEDGTAIRQYRLGPVAAAAASGGIYRLKSVSADVYYHVR